MAVEGGLPSSLLVSEKSVRARFSGFAASAGRVSQRYLAFSRVRARVRGSLLIPTSEAKSYMVSPTLLYLGLQVKGCIRFKRWYSLSHSGSSIIFKAREAQIELTKCVCFLFGS
jgi:hypothetical protein